VNPTRYGDYTPHPDHPLVGTRWASNNGHYPLRVVMAIAESADGRFYAHLTNNIPGMTTWRLLDAHGDVSGHHKIADADPAVERITSAFRGIIDATGTDVSAAVAEALRYPNYQPLPGPGDANPKAKVELDRMALAALGRRILELSAIVEQTALSTFDSPAAGYSPGMFDLKAIEEAEAALDRATELLADDQAVQERAPQ
jgi:hypothetical protein